MAVDGSFSLESELGRFLHRCPKLKSVPCFDILLKKGDKITEEEVVRALGELVLHPNYTIPLLGCFRPIAKKILERTVVLLRLVPNLRSDDDNYVEEFDEDRFLREDENFDSTEIASVIAVYSKRGKGLRLHELACLAFCRALDLIPFLLGSILNYFKVAPAPFERIMQCKSVSKALTMGPHHLLDVVRASYRFLILEPEVFTTLWDWSCILDLVQQSGDLTMVNDPVLRNIIFDLKWCSIGILSMVLRLSFKASAKLGLGSEEAFQSYMRWQEFCVDVSLEKGGWYLESSADEAEAMVGRKTNAFQLSSLSACYPMANEIDPSNQIEMLVTGNPGTPFILTSAMTKSFEMVSLAVNQRWPVLLYGPAGCGKTALINKLAHSYGSRDIDKAPPDIMSILLPLLEGAVTFSTGHGEAVRVNESFRLFSTVASTKTDASRLTEGRNSLGAVWRKVMISPPSNQDLLHIVLEWYPELEYLAQNLIETLEKANYLTRSQLGLTASSSYHDRFTLRDLLKLCKRVASSGFCFGQDTLSASTCENICKEAIDVFASFSTSAGNRLAIVREIAKLWTVAEAETLYPVNKPIIQELKLEFQVGRVSLQHAEMAFNRDRKPFVLLRASVHALERIACSVKFNEPVLLVGETGTGKTTLVQALATRLGQKLTVLNLSQQSDAADLLGGFKPMDARFVCIPLYQEFENLFTNTFSSKDNERFLIHLRKFLSDKNWKMLLSGFQKGIRKIVEIGKSSSGKKRKRPLSQDLLKAWENFSKKCERAHTQVSASDGMVFSFVEGAFITALKNGEWILLDEVNLAPPEILQRVIGVLEDEKGSICLSERGDVDYVCRHPNFRMFACMNPATDAGKRDLPFSLRSRFTEYFVDDVLDDEDLILFIDQFIDDDPSVRRLISNVVEFYKAAKESEERLQDGANQRPHYSLRSLYRALEYFKKARRHFGFEKSLYDGFCMFFLNSLDHISAKLMNSLICKHLLGGETPPPLPFDSYLMVKADSKADDINYVLTKSVKEHLKNLARAIFIGRYPVLLQGPTSSGKTSLVRFLAAITGHEFVRINNHEHTDLQEYLGSYITDASGKLVFHEGALVKAVRKGHWIVLDELNLAPSDVLEALNRLLDDNRELFVPELRETIRAHPDFMLFATQNPPVVYAGRKVLSRAFRNRFVEIHVDEIPQEELSTILEMRQSSKVFAGKHGFITPRDLFRWADRFRTYGNSYEDLGYDGYYLMAERLRDDAEKRIVKEVLERQLRIKFSDDELYKQEGKGGDSALKPNKHSVHSGNIGKIIWIKSMWRMYFLVERCYKMREPVLLVGETGGGKTTVCQLLSIMLGSKLHVLNCHQYTETSDFLGGFYPVRERSRINTDFQNLCEQLAHSKAFIHFPGNAKILMDINQASPTLNMLSVIIRSYREHSVSHPEVTVNELDYIEKIYLDLCQLQKKWQTLFMWQDGPLVEAMKSGDLFLVDEISLADDSVLERLNSVLEPERKLSLAEKGGSQLENIIAHPTFFLLATMNPGGDYGKKELSPALRNRFTEIWVPSVSDMDELKSIALERVLNPELAHIVDVMLDFWEWFNLLQTGRLLTIRDLLSWVSFTNVTEKSLGAEAAFVHGAFLVLLDGLSLGMFAWLSTTYLFLYVLRFVDYNLFSTFETAPFALMYHSYVCPPNNLAMLWELSWLASSPPLRSIYRISYLNERCIGTLSVNGQLMAYFYVGSASSASSVVIHAGSNISKVEAAALRLKCLSFLLEKLKEYKPSFDPSSLDGLESYGWTDPGSLAVLSHAANMECDNLFEYIHSLLRKRKVLMLYLLRWNEGCLSPDVTVKPGKEMHNFMGRGDYFHLSGRMLFANWFSCLRDPSGSRFGIDCIDAEGFNSWPLPLANTLRVLRAMQLNRPASSLIFKVFMLASFAGRKSGVGKTSLIAALGRFSGHTVTDIMDLLGSDLPVESDEGIQFAWSDGILLQALKKGSWVLLDELNLAPQSVLEGLNAILDHRAEVFIPELGRSFKCPTSFRVFACQNPSYQGGGRKGLPKSFLNRFTKVYVDELVDEDYISICSSLFPSIERSLLLKLVVFNKEASEKSKPDCFLSSIYLQRMRTSADRIEVLKLYEQIFGAKPFVNPHPRVKLNSDSLVVGDVSIERYLCQSSGVSSNNLKILPGLRHCLEAVGQCVKHQWLCILVGPPSSGKTSLIRMLAELTGNVLNELNLSSATDISELLGCFEQHNASRHYHLAIAQVERYMNEYCNLQLEFSLEAFIRRKDLTTRWLAFSSNINSSATFINDPRMRDSIPQLVEIIEHLKLDVDKQTLPLSWSQKDLDRTLNMIRKLEEDHQKRQHSVKFEWVTGLLIKAIENGEWIVLENANLCNPTVLDRINSLVEQSGSITINECGTVEGNPVVIQPHPKFRMFLTVNPSYGEVSRAMRNRGVEIYLMHPWWLMDPMCGNDVDEIELREVKRFIALCGIPVGKLVDMMAKAHLYAKHEGSRLDVTITYLELSRWVQLMFPKDSNGVLENSGAQRELELAQKKLAFAADWVIEQATESDYLLYIRWLEEKVLDLLAESPSSDVLFKSYNDLLEHHTLFWNSVILSQTERRLISWWSLIKDSVKLQGICPAETELFQASYLVEMKKLDGVSSLCLNSSKSLLWRYGGHPIMPSSADLYQKQLQLSDLCEAVWQRKNMFMKLGMSGSADGDELDEVTVDGALFSNVELRVHAMQGVCMSAYIIGKADNNDSETIQQLEEMYQLLLERLDFEKQKLVVKLTTTKLAPWSALCSACCVFSPDVLCRRSGLECWLKTQPIVDETSLCLDLELLQHLTKITVVDIKEQHQALLELSGLLRSSWNFSLDYSSRPLTDFLPHQNILWILDAWESVHGDSNLYAWIMQTLPEDDVYGTLLPHKLFWPLKLATVDQILQNPNSIREYHLHNYKLRAASRNIWRSSKNMTDSHDMLLSVAQSLFQQLENVKVVVSLLPSSDHYVFTSLINSYIEPLLSELYPVRPSEDIQNLGCALTRIGGLRYNLLVCCDDLDPTLKYSIRHSELTEKINSLEIEIQMVFRPNPGKYKELKHMCDEFLVSVTAMVEWINDLKSWRIEEVTDQVRNWQETTSRFIDRLSNEYSSYMDIIEPVQVSVYEMKLGLSLIVSGVLYKKYLANGEDDINSVLSIIHKFVRFPRVCASKVVSVKVGRQPILSTCDIELPMSIEEIDMNVLQNVIGFTRDAISTKEASSCAVASTLPFKVSIYHNILTRIKDSAADTRFLGGSSFKRLHEIFDDIASLWMKHRSKPIDECKSQQFKFRTRAFKIESIIDIDVSSCANLLANDSFSEWQELLADELDEKIRVNEEDDALELNWNAEESDLDGIVNIHNQLFGSVDLVQRPGSIQVSDTDRLSSFIASYMLGVKVTRDLKGSFSSTFDAKIAPEHLLRLCLEHDDKFTLSRNSTRAYNFYKDSNSPMMAKLVEPVSLLKQRILVLLKEWDDHPALQKIIEVIDMILALPLDTSLAKALSALEFLLNRVRIVQETVAKFPLSDQLEPIFSLVSSWHKLEFESWPALLDEVQNQFENNAGKISNDLNWKFYTSACQEENVKILYNTFGFYVQLLPRILEHIEANRRSIEKELNELLKLCRWDRIENYLAIESFKRTRLKLRKIVKKYTDLLQQPLMEFLGRETSQSGMNIHSIQVQKTITDACEVSRTLLDTVCNQTQCKANDSSIWFADWWKNLERVGELMDGIKDSIPSQSSCLLNWEERKQLWHTIESLCLSLIHCGELWEDKSKTLGKRRALSDLLKLLDSCGLSKHRTSVEGQYGKSQPWLLQPSYEVQHLLLTESDHSSKIVGVDFDHLQSSSREIIWKTANTYYFKSIASTKSLEKICLNFHKDFSLIQVKRSGSYVDHLIEIQQEQRAVAYNFAKKLKCLRQYIWPLSNLFGSINSAGETSSDGSLIKNQHATFKCMWQQKQLFDGFCSLLYEEHLLLQKVQNNHLDTCSDVKDGVKEIRLFIHKVLPDFQKSKNLLDHHLLGSFEDNTIRGVALHPYGVTKEMEQLVDQNFELIKSFEKNLSAFHVQEDGQGAVRNILLGHIEDLLTKARNAEEFYSSLEARKFLSDTDVNGGRSINELETDFHVALKGIYKHILGTFENVRSLNYDFALTEESLKNMKQWKNLFEEDIEHLQLDVICEDVLRIIQSAGELLNYSGDNNSCISSVCVELKNVHVLLDMILSFGDNLLQDILAIHSMVSKVTYALANILASLFAKGFGTTEDQENENEKEATQDAHGTGMGEGAGLNDSNEERDAKSDMPSKNEKGIEMEEDFNADAFSVSEDSEDDENEDNQDEQLESAMGEVGDDSNIVDEKLGDNNDDENRNSNEKYENGPSVKDKSLENEELRAKEDSTATEEDGGDIDAKESGEQKDNGNEEDYDGAEDMKIDKDDAFVDPSGINPEDQNQMPEEDTNVDELEANEPLEDGETEDMNDSDVKNNEEQTDELLEEPDSEHPAENGETANAEESCLEKDTETDFRTPKQDFVQSTPNDNNAAQSAGQSVQNFSDTADVGDFAPDEKHSDFSEFKNDLAQTSGQPNASEFEVRVADSKSGVTLSNEQSRASLPPSESLTQKVQPNPCRSLGDALDGWKERVKVSVDLEDQIENSDDLMEENNADEFGYTAEFKEGTAQALGPATADQIKGDIGQNDTDREMGNTDTRDPTAETEIEKRTSETGPIRNSALNSVNDVQGQQKYQIWRSSRENRWKLMVIIIKILLFFPMSDDEMMGKAHVFEPSVDKREDAATIWRRYELLTTRLSQELAEQLRLVMEPTLASKLQGDYKTGKRINMKKVIPYVASHYRKDKIWLRRTRPSKRDYQVVIAVDDSRSMSEGHCGNFAVEALVTVCRAMSQLEVGNLAVASFGQQGNIRLLHDFDKPFTPEAGIEMISSFTFKQENTIADEPMVDLLKYLNNMLDTAVMQARLPSGHNPLQQLVLIIADGRFNEKEKLKRYVRDILSKKRMVAFLLLDSPNESIMEFMEATVQGKDIKFSKYLDSFPFPYYVVLKNIEALPRTLADLLRQDQNCCPESTAGYIKNREDEQNVRKSRNGDGDGDGGIIY
ncbi:hypothetical protein DH2020_041213 [Rehmannia glutinosa]|uniref:Midasin n=1 Tax=Rehmannia glutinosa TaxID=99300 RepID=A0ABR0USB5_REHGL